MNELPARGVSDLLLGLRNGSTRAGLLLNAVIQVGVNHGMVGVALHRHRVLATLNARELLVYFPSNRITPGSHPPMRLTFATRVFNFTTMMAGEVFDPGGENLPQSINGGDASPLVSTNDLRVVAPLEKLQVLSGLELGSRILTPNADGVNDDLQISFTLQGIVGGKLAVELYDLSGRLVRRLVDTTRGEGRYTETWDGTDGSGRVVPGLYLLRIAVGTDLGTFEDTRTVAVAY